MSSYVAGLKRFFDDIVIIDIAHKPLIRFASIIILVISAVLVSSIGFFGLLIIPIFALAFLLIKYADFPILLFLLASPFVISFAWFRINLFNYGFVMLIAVLWITRKLASSHLSISYSRSLLILAVMIIFLVLASMLPGGMDFSELQAFIRFLLFFAFVLILYDTLDQKDIFYLFIAMSIPVLAASYFVISIYTHPSNAMAVLDMIRNKVTGFLPDANLSGILLMAVIPFWISIALWWSKTNIRIIAGFLSIVFSIAIILTNSRASIFGFIAALFAFSIWAKKVRYFIAIAALIIMIILSVPQIKTLVSLTFRIDRGTSSRTEIWYQTFVMIKDNFWLGVGMGNYRYEYYEYYNLGWERGFFRFMPHAHNFILTKIAELGIFSLIIIAAIYYLPMRTCIRSLKNCATIKEKAIMRGLTTIFISYYAHSIFEGGGMLQEGRLYPDIIFWILFILTLKMNVHLENKKIIVSAP